MKKATAAILTSAFAIGVILSFLAGGYLRDQEYAQSRTQRCRTLIQFAIDKAENRELSEKGVMEALISDLYAAHEFCDDPEISAELNDLWNSLVFRSESHIGQEEVLATQLKGILERCR